MSSQKIVYVFQTENEYFRKVHDVVPGTEFFNDRLQKCFRTFEKRPHQRYLCIAYSFLKVGKIKFRAKR